MIADTSANSAISNESRKVLKNTYMLLGMNIFTSALVAYFFMGSALPIPWYFFLPIYFVLLFAVEKTADSAAGFPMSFVFTGFLGYTLAPIVGMLTGTSEGTMILVQALTGTAIMFTILSFWTMTRKVTLSDGFKSFLSVGILSGFILSILNAAFFQLSAISLVISVLFMFFSSAVIVWQISDIVDGGERSYIRAAMTLYVQLYNMLLSLLNILGFANSD